MGSQLTKNYNIEEEPCAIGGPGNVWRIHRAKAKTVDKTPCSIFFFDKKELKDSKTNIG